MSKDSDPRGLSRILKLSLDAAFGTRAQPHAVVDKLQQECKAENAEVPASRSDTVNRRLEVEISHVVFHEGLQNPAGDACGGMVSKSPPVCKSGRGRGRMLVEKSKEPGFLLQNNEELAASNSSESQPDDIHLQNVSDVSAEVAAVADFSAAAVEKDNPENHCVDMVLTNEDNRRLTLKKEDLCELPDLVKCQMRTENSTPRNQQLKAGTAKQELSSHSSTLDCQAFNHKTMAASHLLPSKSLTPESNTSMGGKYPHGLEKQIKEAVSPSVTPWTDKEKPDCAKVFRGKRTGQQFRAHSRKYFRKRERFSSVIYEGYTEDRPWQTLKQPVHKIYAEAYWDNDKATNKQTQNISFCWSDKRTFRTQPHQLNQGHRGKGKGAKQQAGDVSKTKQQEGNAYKAKQQEGNASKTKQQEGNASKTKQQDGDASKAKQQEGDVSKAKQQEGNAYKAKQQEVDASKAKQQERDASKAKQQEGNANKVKQHEEGDSKTKQQERDVSKTKQHEGNASKAKQQEGNASKTKQQKGDVSKAKQQEGNANKAKQQEGNASKTKQQEGDARKTKQQEGDVSKAKQQEGDVNKAKQQEGDASKAKQQEGDASKSKQQKGDAIKAKQQDRDSIKAKQHEGDGSKAKPQEGDGEKAKQQDRDSIKVKQCGDISKPKQQDRDSIKAKQWGDYTSKAKQQEGDARKAKQAGDASKAEQQGNEVSKLKQLEGNASRAEQQGEEVSKCKQLEGDASKGKQQEGDAHKAKQQEGDASKAKQQEGDASKAKQQEGDASKAKQQEGDPSKAKQQEGDTSKSKQQEGDVSKAKQQKTNQGKSSQQEAGDIKSKQLEADQRHSNHQKTEASNEYVGCNSSVHTMLNAIYQSYEQEAIEYDDKTAAELPGFNLKLQESKCIEYMPRETSVHSHEKSSLESAAKEQREGHTVASIQKGEDGVCVYVERKEVIKSTSGESMGAIVCAKEESKNCLSASEQKEVIVCEQSAAAAAEEKRRDNNYISEEKEELHVFTPQKKQNDAFASEEKEELHVFTSQEKRHDAHASEVNREVKISVSNIRRDTLRNYKDLLVKNVNYETVKINQDLENNLESAPIMSQEIQPPSCHVSDNSSKCSTDLPVTVESECSRLCETDLSQNRLQKNSAVHCTSVAPKMMPSQQIMVDQPRESHSNVSEVSRQDNSPFEFSRHPDNYSRPASSYCASEERQGNVSFTPLFHTRELSLPAETVGSEAAMEEVTNFLKSCSMDIQQHMSQYNENHPLDMTITVSLTHPPLPDYIPRLPYHGHPCLGDRPRMPCPPPIVPYSGPPCHGDRPRLPCPPPIFPYPGHPFHGDRPRLPYPPPFFPYPGWFPAHPFSWNWWPWFERYSANISPYIGYIPPPFTCHPPTVQPMSPKDNDPPPLDASNLLPSQSDGNGQGPAFSRAHADHFCPKMYSRWNPAVFDRQQEPRRAYSYTEELPLGRPEFWTPEMAANHPNGNAEGGDNSVTMSQTSQNVAEEEKWNDRDSRASSEPLAESVTAASTASQDSLRPRRRNSASSVISSVSNRSSKSRGLPSQRFQTLAAKRKSAPYHMTRPWKAHQTLKRRRQSCPSAVNMSAAKQYSKPEEKKRLKSETGLLLSPNDIAGTKCVSGNGWAVSLVARSRSYTHKFIDSHCHIDYLYGKLEILRETLFSTFQKQSAWMFPSNYEGCVAVFCNPNTFNADNPKDHILHSVSTEDGIWLAVGCHPKYAEEFTDAHLRGLRNILKHPKVVALGEIGLDYSGTFQQYSEVQKLVFRQQIQLALELNLPIVVHCRDADDDCLEILTQMVPSDYKIHAHCFTRDISTALRWITPFPNLFLGLTPLVTYKTPLDALNTATFIPLDRLLLETDAPFFLPSVVHYKDMRCSHPGFALYVAEKVAELKHITVNEVLKACRENTKKMYGI